jgi:hypothetical protein
MALLRREAVLRTLKMMARWGMLACVMAGGVLWALSPLGIHISELKFHTPNVFWRLFPSAPLLLLAGLIGLYLIFFGRSGWLERVGFLLALLGLALILVCDVGQFWLGLNDRYIMTAPAYGAFRAGLVVFAAGSILLGVAAGRDRMLPVWCALPFAIGALCGLISFFGDLGRLGAALWILFGLGWAWLGFTFLTRGVLSYLRVQESPVAGSHGVGGRP